MNFATAFGKLLLLLHLRYFSHQRSFSVLLLLLQSTKVLPVAECMKREPTLVIFFLEEAVSCTQIPGLLGDAHGQISACVGGSHGCTSHSSSLRDVS